jgi:hypothetical protein
MALFRNTSQGARGILLRNGEHLLIEVGEELRIARAAIKRMPDGIEEVAESRQETAKASFEPLPEVSEATASEQRTNNPLDHDGDGKAGGSLKGEKSTASKGRRRKRG